MFIHLKHKIIKIIENIPLLQIFIYNNLHNFRFLFPHDKDYYALKLLFKTTERRSFADIGGNIGLSTIGFRELGFLENKIHIFEPDKLLIKSYLNKIKKFYNDNFFKYKDSVKTVGWSSKKDQYLRFEKLFENIEVNNKSILDIGCGLGDLIFFIKKNIKAKTLNILV